MIIPKSDSPSPRSAFSRSSTSYGSLTRYPSMAALRSLSYGCSPIFLHGNRPVTPDRFNPGRRQRPLDQERQCMTPMNALFHQATTQPDGIGLDRFCPQIVDKRYESLLPLRACSEEMVAAVTTPRQPTASVVGRNARLRTKVGADDRSKLDQQYRKLGGAVSIITARQAGN
jgi:hypothetical protein